MFDLFNMRMRKLKKLTEKKLELTEKRLDILSELVQMCLEDRHWSDKLQKRIQHDIVVDAIKQIDEEIKKLRKQK